MITIQDKNFKSYKDAQKYFNIDNKDLQWYKNRGFKSQEAFEDILKGDKSKLSAFRNKNGTPNKEKFFKNKNKQIQPKKPENNCFIDYIDLSQDELIEIYKEKAKTEDLESLNKQYLEILAYIDYLKMFKS